MAEMTYDVILHDGAWQVRFDGIFYGQRPYQAAAVGDAIAAAVVARKEGYDVGVMLHEEEGHPPLAIPLPDMPPATS